MAKAGKLILEEEDEDEEPDSTFTNMIHAYLIAHNLAMIGWCVYQIRNADDGVKQWAEWQKAHGQFLSLSEEDLIKVLQTVKVFYGSLIALNLIFIWGFLTWNLCLIVTWIFFDLSITTLFVSSCASYHCRLWLINYFAEGPVIWSIKGVMDYQAWQAEQAKKEEKHKKLHESPDEMV